jgi:hypothetical protein
VEEIFLRTEQRYSSGQSRDIPQDRAEIFLRTEQRCPDFSAFGMEPGTCDGVQIMIVALPSQCSPLAFHVFRFFDYMKLESSGAGVPVAMRPRCRRQELRPDDDSQGQKTACSASQDDDAGKGPDILLSDWQKQRSSGVGAR